jgi:glutaredoxin
MDMRLTFFTKSDCELCDAAWFVVQKVVAERDIAIDVVDLEARGNARWAKEYGEHIPVLHVNGKEFCRHRVVEKELRRALKGCD